MKHRFFMFSTFFIFWSKVPKKNIFFFFKKSFLDFLCLTSKIFFSSCRRSLKKNKVSGTIYATRATTLAAQNANIMKEKYLLKKKGKPELFVRNHSIYIYIYIYWGGVHQRSEMDLARSQCSAKFWSPENEPFEQIFFFGN